MSTSSATNATALLPPLIPNLPDDIAARCIALLPLSSHPSLSLVSRSWLSLLRSPLLSSLRSSLRLLHPVLVISIRTPTDPSLWFLLYHHRRRPVPLPSPSLPTVGSAACPLGPALYLLGGSHSGLPTRSIQILDPRSRRWSPGPTMRTAREFPAAAAIAGRIYVLGGCLPHTPSWAESLDPTAGPLPRWANVPSPAHLRDKWMHGHAILGGRLLAVADRGGVQFDPAAAEWGPVSPVLDLGWKGRAAVVGGVLYSYDYLGKVKGYDPAREEWMQVEGVEKELPRFLCGATLADLGGLLCLVWEGKAGRRAAAVEVEICCAGIDISRTDEGGLRGKVVWLEEAVLALPRGSAIAHCVTVEL